MVAWLGMIGNLDCPKIAGTLLKINVQRIRESMICIIGWYNEAIANLKKRCHPIESGGPEVLEKTGFPLSRE
jgi:hypothetical protein